MASSYLNDVRVRYIKLTNEIRWDLKYNLLRITNVAWWVQMKMMKYVVKIFPLFPPPQRSGQARQPTLGIFIEISRIWEIQTAKHLSVSRCINSLLQHSEYHSFQKAVQCCRKQYVHYTGCPKKNARSWHFGYNSTLEIARNKVRVCFEKFRKFSIW